MSRSGFKKTVSFLHLWLGLIFGLVVFVLGVTGAIYAFSDELKELCYKDRLTVPVPEGKRKLAFEQLILSAEQALGKSYRISRSEISATEGRTYMFRALKVDKDAIGYQNYYKYYYKAYINPYTGKLVKLENAKNEFFTIVLAAHMNLLLGDRIGSQIVRYSVICFVALLLSGLILWWPKNRKAWKNSVRIKFNAKFRRLNYDLHNVLGFYAFIILLMISLTGLIWSFNLASDKKQTLHSDSASLLQTPHQLILNDVNKQSPHAAYLLYNFPAQKTGTVNVSAYASDKQLYDKIQYRFDQYSGVMLECSKPFRLLSLRNKVGALNYDVHTGAIIGLPGKLLACIASLIAASLPVTGFIFYLLKKR